MKFLKAISILLLLPCQFLIAQSVDLNVFKAQQEKKFNDISFYVKVDDKAKLVEYVDAVSGKVYYGFDGYHHVVIPMEYAVDLYRIEGLQSIMFNYQKPVLLCDSMRANSNIISVHNGVSPLPHPYTGKDVIVGIIDTGIDFNHPDFIDSNGNTRVMYIWDQNITSPSKTPDNFNYGQLWDSTDINNGVCTHMDPASYYGHGTNVSALAASNGNATGTHIGAAPDANLIVVSLNFTSPSWLNDLADGVEFIYSMADSMGMPCVVNISAGTYEGTHDGLDIPAQRIDSLIKAQTGRALTASAGNSGEVDPYHLGYELSSDTLLTWFEHNSSLNFGIYGNDVIFFELYSDTNDIDQAWVTFGADLTTGIQYQNRGSMQFINPPGLFDGTYSSYTDGNGIYNDSIVNPLGEKLADVYIGYYTANNNRTSVLQFIIDPDSSDTDYKWRFETTGEGKFDVWSTSWANIGTSDIESDVPNSSIFPDSIYYRKPDSLQSIVSSFQCLPDVITVGNYVNRNQYVDYNGMTQIVTSLPSGHLFSSSSLGPNRLGDTKPTVASPGSATMAATRLDDLTLMATANPAQLDPDGMHRTANGTSMAAPGVAGVVALLFESCNSFTYEDINNALTQGAKRDQFTTQFDSNHPNNYFGYGKVNAFNSLKQTGLSISLLDGGGLVVGDTLDVCENDVLSIDQQFVSQYWNTGSNDEFIAVNSSGNYFATGIDVDGCLKWSDSVYVNIDPFSISSPLLNIGDSSSCEGDPILLSVVDSYDDYLWSTGSNSSNISPSITDTYFVLVTDEDGCMAYSEDVELTFFVNPPTPQITVFNDTVLSSTVSFDYQWYFGDSILLDGVDQVYIASDSGYYYVETFHPNGCSTISDSVYVQIPLSMYVSEIDNLGFSLFPNPTSGLFQIQFSNSAWISCELVSVTGQVLKTFNNITNQTSLMVDLNENSSGVYFIRVEGFEKVDIQKITKY